MKHFAMASALTALMALTACNNQAGTETETTETVAATVTECPAEKIITDISAYPNTAPAAQDDFAAWHTENGKRDGVITTDSGLQYSVVQEGIKGGVKPVGSQMIKVNYHGFFPNGEKFDSSYERGEAISFPANGVIKGWIEALGGMKPCEARTLYIPGNLAYGPSGRGPIPPNATLLFHVQLLGVEQ